jgi:hypothetical protein
MLAAVRPIRLILLVAVIALPAAVFAYLRFTPLALQDVRVSGPQACRPMEPARAPQADWSQGALQLRMDVTANCAAGGTTWQVQRLGPWLLARHATPEPAVATGCWCSRAYVLEAAGLPRQDYRVIGYSFP